MSLYTDPVIASWIDLATENQGTDRFQVSYAAFQAILDGEALTVPAIESRTDLQTGPAADLVPLMLDEGRLRASDDGERVIGAAGLTLEPSRHTLHMNGRTFGVWCALDAVGIPAGLDLDATVESVCDITQEPLEIEIHDGRIRREQPADLTISLVPASMALSVYDRLCSRILFYSEPPDVPDPEAEYLPIRFVADLGRRIWRDGVPL